MFMAESVCGCVLPHVFSALVSEIWLPELEANPPDWVTASK